MKKRSLILIAGITILAVVLLIFWNKKASPTKIALVNFQNFQVAKMIRSADPFITTKQLSVDEFHKLR